MAIATLTSKGQVTIPKTVRDALQLREGDKVDFMLTENGEALLKPMTKTVKVDEIFGELYKSDRKPVSVQQMKSGIKQKMKVRFK
ncbi:MAG: AbrB/MazE/SpoVT family DNA-binding domain-containing protein [Gemmatimonadota bacterium]|nr:AbrB/MazE/SpoVT family DNA-binding domain-containing protein [Gemmatimonadota bacterium]